MISQALENLKKFTLAILALYVITVPVSSSSAETGSSPLFQQGINALTILTTLMLLLTAFLQYRSDKESIRTEPYIVITAGIYLIICCVSAALAEHDIEHCLTRVFTLFCFLNNAFWPHILFPKIRQANLLTRIVIFGSLTLCTIYGYIWVLRGGSFNRYDYNDFGNVFGLSPELGFAYDPNIMLFGFIYGIVCLFIIYSEYQLRHLWQKILVAMQGLLIFTFLIFLFSRTTAISLTVTVLIFLARRFYRNPRFWFCIGLILFLVIITLPELTELINKSEFYANVTEGREISNEDRVFRLEYSINLWLSELKSIIIGRGYGIEILEYDPHNIYLTHLYSNGVLGFAAFFAFVTSIKLYGQHLTAKEKSIIDLSMIYIGIGAMTYWHNKSMWVIFMLCLMRTRAYRARHDVPDTKFDFEENPVTQFGSRIATFLTGLVNAQRQRFMPKSWPAAGRSPRQAAKAKALQQKAAKQKLAKSSKRPAPRQKVKVNVPDWAKKPALDFDENPMTRLGKAITTLLTGLQKSPKRGKPKPASQRKQPAPRRKVKVNVPEWAKREAAEQKAAAERQAALDFEENPMTRLGKKITSLFTSLQRSPNETPSSKKIQQMSQKENKRD